MSELQFQSIPENHPKLRQLREAFAQLVIDASQTTENVNPNRFPGTMALTLSRRHLGMIAKNDYVVLEKSDGQRYMLFALPDMVFLVDRLMNFYVVDPNPDLFYPTTEIDSFERHDRTILDGELVHNQVTDKYEYLIYDAVVIHGNVKVGQLDFRGRMAQVELFVVSWRITTPYATGLLRLRVKDYFEKRDLRRLFNRIKKDDQGQYIYLNDDRRDGAICNENDGVIFTPVKMPYVVKNCDALLKWKPPHLNSVDFLLQLSPFNDPRTQKPSCKAFIAYRGERSNTRLRQVHFPSKVKHEWAKNIERYHDSIVELSYDRMAGEWRYIRQRDDKKTANFSSTVIDTMESIAENMEREELVTFMESHARSPPPDAKQYLEHQRNTDRACRVRDDLFDADNKSYLLTTPVSLVPKPSFNPSRVRSHRRGNYSNASHNRPRHPTGRVQPEYVDDV